MKSILLVKKRLGLVEMTSGLVNASFSLPETASCKNDFLCTVGLLLNEKKFHTDDANQCLHNVI